MSLYELLEGKPAIISFYRGSWCPYCNLELRHYDMLLQEEDSELIRMFAISPELPDPTMNVKDLNFTVLSDVNNELAKKLSLVFTLPEDIKELYQVWGIDLAGTQGNDEQQLPVPATFVLDSQGVITHVELDEDYTKRPEPKDIINKLKENLNNIN